MTGLLISFEGISGVGKTYITNLLMKESNIANLVTISELSDRKQVGLDTLIVDILRSVNDDFFRTGHPITETFLILALKMHDYEKGIKSALEKGKIVIEDRSIDTIAVYQSILLHPNNSSLWLETAEKIYSVGAAWRKSPEITFLLYDDFNKTVRRAEERNGRLYADDEIELLFAAYNLYFEYSHLYKERFHLIDRNILSESETVSYISKVIHERI